MLNIFKAKRIGGLFLTALLPFILFLSFLLTGYGLFWATVAWLIGTALAVLLYRRVLVRHPYIDYLEGSGIVVRTLDSTGLIRTYVVRVDPPHIVRRDGEPIDYFDRDFAWYEYIPKEVRGAFFQRNVRIGDREYAVLGIPEDELNEAKFVEENHIVFFWNPPTGTFLTKDVLGKFEKELLTNHLLLYLVEKVKELSTNIRDFARYVVEMTKPQKRNLLQNWWVWVLIILAVGVIIYLGWQAYAGAVGGASTPATPSPIVSPRG